MALESAEERDGQSELDALRQNLDPPKDCERVGGLLRVIGEETA
jgi:hypothetical protein